MKYTSVACGGTFDLLHAGHKAFLEFAFSLGEKVTIGITSDRYVEEFKIHSSNEVRSFANSSHPGYAEVRTIKAIESFVIRKKNVEKFLNQQGFEGRFEIVAIDDAIGPAGSSTQFEALIVTDDTKHGAENINKKRIENGLKALVVEVFEELKSEDGKVISSTRIRNGEISRDGKLWIKKEWLEHDLKLPEGLREELQKPFGEIVHDIDSFSPAGVGLKNIICVGDVTTKTFIENGIMPRLAIVDFLVERKKRFEKIYDLGFSNNEEVVKVKNPAGKITKELFEIIKQLCYVELVSASNSKKILLPPWRDQDDEAKIIVIDGEEDLAVLPLILVLPLGVDLFYGQPHEGIVHIVISEEQKQKVYTIASKFTLV